MQNAIKISREDWNRLLIKLSDEGENIYAPVQHNGVSDYELLNEESIGRIVYNEAKPVSPLKIFFLPVRLNVTRGGKAPGRTVIIGAPACDIEGLKLLDAIYIDEKYTDETYLSRRQNSIIIGAPCHKAAENCHCTTYGMNPWPVDGCDISMSYTGEDIVLNTMSEKGTGFMDELKTHVDFKEAVAGDMDKISKLQKEVAAGVTGMNNGLPGKEETGELVLSADRSFWKEHSSKCVSCGACAAICPTCTCFLLIDRPGFEKIKQQDTCQYPAFERVAGGEDPLKELSVRFQNRYMCKFVWKPDRFGVLACTGCGRCIDACIAGISKNEVIREMT